MAAGERVFAYLFWDENKKESQYWRDVGTIDAYYEASMDLIQVDPVFNLYDPDWPMRTYQPQLPPAKFVFAEDGRRGVRHASRSCPWAASSPAARCAARSSAPTCASTRTATWRTRSSCPARWCDRHARIRRAIIDRGVEVPRGALVGYDAAEDRRRHTVSDGGVVVVTPGEECFVQPDYR